MVNTKDLSVDDMDTFLREASELASQRRHMMSQLLLLNGGAQGKPSPVDAAIMAAIASNDTEAAVLSSGAGVIEVLGRILEMQADTLDAMRALRRELRPQP